MNLKFKCIYLQMLSPDKFVWWLTKNSSGKTTILMDVAMSGLDFINKYKTYETILAEKKMKLKGDTIPAINNLKENKNYYLDSYMKLHPEIHKTQLNLVSFHKMKLGKQFTCFNGEFRYWVWEGSVAINEHHSRKWRVFVSNTKGIGFEVDTGREDVTIKLWKDYLDKIGLSHIG